MSDLTPPCDVQHPKHRVRCVEPSGHDGDHRGQPDPRTNGRVEWSSDDSHADSGPE